jgi:hypothetical protein
VLGQLFLVRFLWVWTAVMLVMAASGLTGIVFSEVREPADVAVAMSGVALAAMSAFPLFVLVRKWRHLRGRTRFSRTTTGRVVLAICVVLGVVFGVLGWVSNNFASDSSGSAASARAAVVLLTLEGAAASGFYLYRGRRAPS